MTTQQIADTINAVFQVLMLIVPIAATFAAWYLRNYAKSASSEKNLAAIVRLSNAAIDFAEDLDKRGDLQKYLVMFNLPPEVQSLQSDGLKKLNIAGKFLEDELGKMGIKMTDEQAKAWVASEFQRRTGDLGQARGTAERVQEAASLLQTLQQAGLVVLPADPQQSAQLASAVTAWVAAQMAKDTPTVSRDAALSEFEATLNAPAPAPTGDGTAVPTLPGPAPAAPSVDVKLQQLALESMQYVEQLKTANQLTLPETDVALAWVLTEVTKQGLPVTTDQIANAVRLAAEPQAPH